MLEQAKERANQIVEETKKKSDELISELRKMKMSAASNIEEGSLIDAQGRVNALHQETNLKKK